MNIEEFKKIVEDAKIGLSSKEEIINAINKAEEIINRYEHGSIENNKGTNNDNEKGKSAFDITIKATKLLNEEISKYREGINALREELDDYKNFKKQRCFENIRTLLKDNPNVKIGQIEKEACVSLGYMSRLEKPDNSSEPSIEFVATAAKMLGISIDALLLTDLGLLNPTEKYLVTFIEKLKKDTLEDKLEWIRSSADELNTMEIDTTGCTGHVLFNLETFYVPGESDYPDEVTRVVFNSHSFGLNTFINDDCFSLKMKNGSTLYLMNICKSSFKTNEIDIYAREIWINTPGVGTYFLLDNKNIPQLSILVNILFDAVKEDSHHPKVKKGIKNVLDAFINEDDLGENDEPDLPF